MITDSIERSKIIKDPLFTSINKYLLEQLDVIRKTGTAEEIKTAESRYLYLKPEEIQIEPPTTFPNGSIRACIAVRSRKFFHADAVITQVELSDIFKDFGFKVTEKTKDQLETAIADKAITYGFFYLTDTNEYVFVLNDSNHSLKDVYKLLGEFYWSKLTVSIDDNMNTSTKRSGTVKITCWNIDHPAMGIYYAPHFAKKKK